MIRKVTDITNVREFARIYNSANLLFAEEMRNHAAEEVFLPQFRQDENYAFWDENKCMVGFYSYHVWETALELTSLYVDFEHQKNRIGERMLFHFESNVPAGETIFIKALKNAPWALNFYQKHGYQPLDDRMALRAKAAGIEEKTWSQVFYKTKVDKE